MGYVYMTDPLDFWNGWHKAEDIVREVGSEITEYDEGTHISKKVYDECLSELTQKATQMGWEGDISVGPFVSVFPQANAKYWHPRIMIGFKQSNNGTTFIYSGWPLYQYEDGTVEEWNDEWRVIDE